MGRRMRIPNPGELAALGTAFCWTITAMAFETAGKRVGSLSVNWIRLVLASLFLALACLAVRGRLLPDDAASHSWFWLTLSGLVGFCMGDLCLFRALVLIGPRLSTLMMSLAPPFAAIIGWMVLRETLSLLDWTGMALTLLGVSWVVLERKSREEGAKGPRAVSSGVLLGLLGAAGQGGGLVLSKFGMAGYHPLAATQIRVFAGIAGFGILFVFLRWWPRVFRALKNRRAMRFTALGAFFGPFLGVSLSLTSIQYIAAGVAQTIMSITPVLIIPFVWVIYKERVSLRATAGALLAVGGVAILFL